MADRCGVFGEDVFDACAGLGSEGLGFVGEIAAAVAEVEFAVAAVMRCVPLAVGVEALRRVREGVGARVGGDDVRMRRGRGRSVEEGFAAGGFGGLDISDLLRAEGDVAFGGEAAGVDGIDGDSGSFELVESWRRSSAGFA